jgi:hypothetical protein
MPLASFMQTTLYLLCSRYLSACPNGEKEDSKEHVSLFLHLKSASSKDFLSKCIFRLVNVEGTKVAAKLFERAGEEFNNNAGWATFMSHQELLSEKVVNKESITVEAKV